MSMPALRNRPRLLHIFRLNCLCLTESSTCLPAIQYQGADSTDRNCRLSSVLLPAQSHLSSVHRSVASCVSESALTKFHGLESRFDSGNIPGHPWIHVALFGQGKLYKTLLTAYKFQCRDVSPTKIIRSHSSSLVNVESEAAFRSLGKTFKSAHEGIIPASNVTKAVKELQGRSSKH